MSTIPSHSRLADVSNAALFRELTADNFAILAEEIGLRLASYQNGVPTTIIGPPTAGTFAQSPRLIKQLLLPNEWVIFEVFRQVGDDWTAALVADRSAPAHGLAEAAVRQK